MARVTSRSILVVDDDLDILEVFKLLLEPEGYHVFSASNGADALRILRQSTASPCLIFLDLRMPVMNGWQFRDEQLRDPELAHIPVVVITADSSPAAPRGVAGGVGVLQKPLQLGDILNEAARFSKLAEGASP